jgi:hypothetical protein
MKAVTETNISDIEPAINEVMPLLSDQKVVFGQLLDSIAYCQELGSSAWSVSHLGKCGFRLNVGQVEAMTCFFYESGFDEEKPVCDLRLVLAGDKCIEKFPPIQAHEQYDEYTYKSVRGEHWCYRCGFQTGLNDQAPDPRRLVIEEHLASLRILHQQFLKLACHSPTGKIRQKGNFARFHMSAIVEYANRVVKSGERPAGITQLLSSVKLGNSANQRL